MATIRVWDIAVRIFHWSLVIAFTTAYLSGDEELLLHINAGYVVLGLIAFRIIWGFIGTRYARFGNFIYSPAKIFAYARSLAKRAPPHYIGHNPLGGLMVVALLIALSATCYTGLKLYAVEEGKGPLAGNNSISLIANAYAHEGGHHHTTDHRAEEYWHELHELFVNLSLGLVALHIAGVVVSSFLHKEALVKAMVTGNKET